jgi:uroporphyrinogen III methyltransferase/synthase
MTRPAVYLIGAGPGDPGLLTVRGLECLRAADVVIHDHGLSPRLLAEARPHAEIIDVGALSSPEALAEEAIRYLLAEKAREGKIVARLKAGDPFVFARGGEEVLFLHEQGVPFEVVPGVASTVGAAAYAGVPATYPGGGDVLTLLRGHGHRDTHALPDVDWTRLAGLDGTIGCEADTRQLARVLDALVAHGWPPDTGAVVVVDGTHPGQQTLTGTAAALAESLRNGPRHTRAVLVTGRVVGFRDHLRWWDARPLSGRRVLVTRPRGQAGELVARLAALGAEPVEAPMIRIAPPEDPTPLMDAAAGAAGFDWIVFSSANAVEAFMTALIDGQRDVRALAGPRLCTTGPGTAARLRRYGITVDLVPDEYRAEALAAAIVGAAPVRGARVLVPRADIGRDVLAAALRAAGAEVTEVVAYRTVSAGEPGERDPDVYRMLLDGVLDAVTFTSGSAVRSFVETFGGDQAVDLLGHTVVAVIGPVTAEVAAAHGIRTQVQPSDYTVAALADALAAHFASR